MRKYLIFCLLIISILIVSLYDIKADTYLPLLNKKIVIDAGHGGLDPGSVVGNIYEKDINLSISLLLKEKLEKMGAIVILTRDSDYDLSSPNSTYRKKSDFDNRLLKINKLDNDLYISIHQNYLSNSSYYGPQVFYDKNNEKLASIMQNSLNKITNAKREIKKIPDSTYLYDKIIIPGVLIECSFMSNPNELNKILSNDYQNILTDKITEGIIIYFS